MVLDSLLLCLPWLQDPFACPKSTAPSFLSFVATKSARGPFLPSSPHTSSASGSAGAGVPFWLPLPLLSFRRRKKDMSHHSAHERQDWKKRGDLLLQRKFLVRQSAVAVFYYLCNCITACRLPHSHDKTVKWKVGGLLSWEWRVKGLGGAIKHKRPLNARSTPKYLNALLELHWTQWAEWTLKKWPCCSPDRYPRFLIEWIFCWIECSQFQSFESIFELNLAEKMILNNLLNWILS